VGRKLWGLAHEAGHQVLCVTHLAQIAAFSDRHYRVQKQMQGERTTTQLEAIAGDTQVDELAQMVGLLSEATRRSASELLDEANSHKTQNGKPVKQAAML
jgi:DNA repair protein RecN (Recombination protein N)